MPKIFWETSGKNPEEYVVKINDKIMPENIDLEEEARVEQQYLEVE